MKDGGINIKETTREIALRTYNELVKDNKIFDSPTIWIAWKRAFDIAEKEFKNR